MRSFATHTKLVIATNDDYLSPRVHFRRMLLNVVTRALRSYSSSSSSPSPPPVLGLLNSPYSSIHLLCQSFSFSSPPPPLTAEGEEDEKIVLKEFKHTGSGRDRRSDYVEIMETQCVAAFMASEFNKVAPPGSKRITFLHVSTIAISVFDIY